MLPPSGKTKTRPDGWIHVGMIPVTHRLRKPDKTHWMMLRKNISETKAWQWSVLFQAVMSPLHWTHLSDSPQWRTQWLRSLLSMSVGSPYITPEPPAALEVSRQTDVASRRSGRCRTGGQDSFQLKWSKWMLLLMLLQQHSMEVGKVAKRWLAYQLLRNVPPPWRAAAVWLER